MNTKVVTALIALSLVMPSFAGPRASNAPIASGPAAQSMMAHTKAQLRPVAVGNLTEGQTGELSHGNGFTDVTLRNTGTTDYDGHCMVRLVRSVQVGGTWKDEQVGQWDVTHVGASQTIKLALSSPARGGRYTLILVGQHPSGHGDYNLFVTYGEALN
ncbi:MAG: hypothetical protein EB084_12530 [Proteobacteria bacterium]|nr:hypothetical protein [Pseudomonadota bacterium]